MIIDAHAHLVAPDQLYAYRANLLADGGYHAGEPKISDDAIAACAQSNAATMDGVGTDLQLLSPRPCHQGHSMQPPRLVEAWIRANNDTIARTVAARPGRFAALAGLPTTPGSPVEACFGGLKHAIDELGFVGVSVNPDPCEGRGGSPALGDRYDPDLRAIFEGNARKIFPRLGTLASAA